MTAVSIAGRLVRSARAMPAGALAAAAVVVVLVSAAVLAPLVAPLDPTRQALLFRLKPPGFSTPTGSIFWFGTDDLGRDLLSRVIFGARASLAVAILSVAASTVFGTLLGMIAGWRRGWAEIAIMRFVDIILSIPAILLAVLTVAVLGPGFLKLILVLGLTRWPRYARVAYAQTLQVATLPYIRAAELAGAGTARILRSHVLPNILGPIVVVATLEFGLMILFEAGLSFLGLGIQPPTPSWGSIMSIGRGYLDRAWWLTAFPGGCLFALVLSVNVVGDWLRDRLDPKSIGR